MQSWDYLIAVIAAAGATAFAGLGGDDLRWAGLGNAPVATASAPNTPPVTPLIIEIPDPEFADEDCTHVIGRPAEPASGPHQERARLLPPCHL
jgi:hypothetical protein